MDRMYKFNSKRNFTYILGNYLEYPTSPKILIKILTFSLKTKEPGNKRGGRLRELSYYLSIVTTTFWNPPIARAVYGCNTLAIQIHYVLEQQEL